MTKPFPVTRAPSGVQALASQFIRYPSLNLKLMSATNLYFLEGFYVKYLLKLFQRCADST